MAFVAVNSGYIIKLNQTHNMKKLTETIAKTGSQQGLKLKVGSRGARTNKNARKLLRRAFEEGQSDAYLTAIVAAAQ